MILDKQGIEDKIKTDICRQLPTNLEAQKMKLEKFVISFLCYRVHESISFSSSERRLRYRKEIDGVFNACLEYYDGFQKFAAEVSEFAEYCMKNNPQTVEPCFKEDYPLFNIDFSFEGKEYSYCFEYSSLTPVQWKKCADALSELFKESNLNSNLSFFERN